MKKITMGIAFMCIIFLSTVGCSSGGGSSSGGNYGYSTVNAVQNQPSQNSSSNSEQDISSQNSSQSNGDGTQKVYALFTGINSTILGSENDARELENALKPGSVNTIWNNAESTLYLTAQTNKSNIQNKMTELAGKADGDDIFLFYYSGHGTRGSIKPSGGNITPSELAGYLSKFSTATKKIVILDCCDSGMAINSLKQIQNITILTATKTSGIEDAQEGSLSSTYLGEDILNNHYGHHHGYFTYFLIRGLGLSGNSMGELSNLSLITLKSLFDYASPKTKDYANYIGKSQSPSFYTNTTDYAIKGR